LLFNAVTAAADAPSRTYFSTGGGAASAPFPLAAAAAVPPLRGGCVQELRNKSFKCTFLNSYHELFFLFSFNSKEIPSFSKLFIVTK